MTEAQFQRQVTELAELLGWAWLHVRPGRTADSWRTPISGSLGKGWPDLFMVRERDGRRLAVELKGPRGRITPDQTRVSGILEAADIECYFWRPSDWAAIEEALR